MKDFIVSAARYLKIVGIQVIALPFTYPILAVLFLAGSWHSVSDFYLNWEFTALNFFGIFVSWNLWNYRHWARKLLVVYALGWSAQTFSFVIRTQSEPEARAFLVNALLSLLVVVPSLRLLWILRSSKRELISTSASMKIISTGKMLSIQMRDLSQSGCRFHLPRGETTLARNTKVMIYLNSKKASLEIPAIVSRTIGTKESVFMEAAVKFWLERATDRNNLKLFMDSFEQPNDSKVA